ncbi:hypothetical protein GW17_00006526 [Ensete ventricosum]|nr:hypothetical protein GW17_00006526 [Ensete ventricosum]
MVIARASSLVPLPLGEPDRRLGHRTRVAPIRLLELDRCGVVCKAGRERQLRERRSRTRHGQHKAVEGDKEVKVQDRGLLEKRLPEKDKENIPGHKKPAEEVAERIMRLMTMAWNGEERHTGKTEEKKAGD